MITSRAAWQKHNILSIFTEEFEHAESDFLYYPSGFSGVCQGQVGFFSKSKHGSQSKMECTGWFFSGLQFKQDVVSSSSLVSSKCLPYIY